MCEKIGGYKTFAHISVCHSTRLSEAGFILSTAWDLRGSLAGKASRQGNYNLLSEQTLISVVAKTPLFARGKVARDNGLGGITSAPFRYHPIERYCADMSAYGAERTALTFSDAKHAVRVTGKDDRRWPMRVRQSLCNS